MLVVAFKLDTVLPGRIWQQLTRFHFHQLAGGVILLLEICPGVIQNNMTF